MRRIFLAGTLALVACGSEIVQIPEPQLQCSRDAHFEAKRGCVLDRISPASSGALAGLLVSPTELAAARRRMAEGKRLMEAGNFAGAIAELDAAEALRASAQTEHLIAKCHDALGHPREAIAAYEKFLAHVPSNMTAEGEEARQRVTALSEPQE